MTPQNQSEILEKLYAQNMELAVKNKTLLLLRKLYDISILALEPKELAKRITKEIKTDLDYELITIALFNSEDDELSFLSMDLSDRIFSEQPKDNELLNNVSIQAASKVDFLTHVISDKTVNVISGSDFILQKFIPQIISGRVNTKESIKSSLIYPLIIEDKTIGILILSINREYDGLIEYEKQSIKSFVTVIAVALDKALTYEALKIANAGQENLIHVMNHQIKGYLAKDRNIFNELLTEPAYGVVASEPAKMMLKEGFESTTKGIDFVQDILKGSSAQKGVLPYNMQSVDFAKIVSDVAVVQKKNAETKGLSFELITGPGDYSITADPTHLSEAVRNLIDNSINYTLSGSIKLDLKRTADKIIFSIKDTGIGITAEDKTKLFTEGGRGKESTKININSTGYGLVFVKAVIEKHGGTVRAESEGAGKGSTFTLELPAKTA